MERMLGEKILSYFYCEQAVPSVSNNQQSNSELLDLVQSLKCSDSLGSIIPSVIYLVGIALLVHHIITMNIRPQLYRRVGRELLLQIPWQEILILMLIYQCIRIWLSTLVLVNTIFKYYQKQLSGVCPWGLKKFDSTNLDLHSFQGTTKFVADLLKLPFLLFYISTGLAPFQWLNAVNLIEVHPLVQTFLLPHVLKVTICSCLSCIPLLALLKLKERRPLPPFMLWMGPMRRDRSELGSSGYYLERPITEDNTPNVSEAELKRSNSTGNVNIIRPARPRRLRARKSVSV